MKGLDLSSTQNNAIYGVRIFSFLGQNRLGGLILGPEEGLGGLRRSKRARDEIFCRQ